MTRAKHTLELFGERIADIPSTNVRVVGTNTLRKATNRDEFLALAEEALGQRVEVISGSEEARLIYVGVANDVQDDGAQRLVVDIGGGSTECIIGFGDQIVRSDSLYMGCVEYSKRFFREGVLSPQSFDEAITAARLELGGDSSDLQESGMGPLLWILGDDQCCADRINGQWSDRSLHYRGRLNMARR